MEQNLHVIKFQNSNCIELLNTSGILELDGVQILFSKILLGFLVIFKNFFYFLKKIADVFVEQTLHLLVLTIQTLK